MMVKHLYQLVIIILSFSNIFSQSITLWDFGVIINKKSTAKESSIKPNAVKSNSENLNIEIDAVIADPFIKPTKVKITDGITNIIDEEKYELNIEEVKSIVEISYFTKNYQNIINVLQNQNLDSFSEQVYIDLNYLLIEAFYHTGKYQKAKENILISLKKYESDRLYFLLSMIYEALDDSENAKNSYLKLIAYYPDSDYFNSAKIKTHILNKH